MNKYMGCKVTRKDKELYMFQPNIMYNLKKEFIINIKEIRKYETPAAPGFTVRQTVEGEKLIPAECKDALEWWLH